MGNIREYNSAEALRGLTPARPSDAGAQALAMEARRTGPLYREAGAEIAGAGAELARGANDFITRKEELQYTQSEPDFFGQGVLGWKDFASKNDITDPAKVADFNEQLRQQDDQFMQSFGTDRGKALAQNAVLRRQEHMQTIQGADISNREGTNGVLAITDSVNKNAAIASQDPSYLNVGLANIDSMVDRLKANSQISEGDRSKFDDLGKTSKQNLAIAAVHGIAERDPKAALGKLNDLLSSGLISEPERERLTSYIDAQERLSDEKAKSDINWQHTQDQREAQDTAAKITMEATDANGNFVPTPNTVNQIKDLAASGQDPMLSIAMMRDVETTNKYLAAQKLKVSDQGVKVDLWNRLSQTGDGQLTRTEVYQAAANEKLSDRDKSALLGAINDRDKNPQKNQARAQVTKFANQLRGLITHSTMWGDFPQEDERYGLFQSQVQDEFEQHYADGTWKDLMDPKSASYLGNTARGYAYGTKDAQQQFMENLQRGTGGSATPAPVPGKAPIQWNGKDDPATLLKKIHGG